MGTAACSKVRSAGLSATMSWGVNAYSAKAVAGPEHLVCLNLGHVLAQPFPNIHIANTNLWRA